MRTPGTAILILFLVLAGCAKTAAPTVDVARDARAALDWAGSYRGVLPCADCPGIETRITLSPDGRYVSQSRYLERDVQPRHESGSFTWNAAGTVVTLSGNSQRYRVDENGLTQLALDGTPITGPLAANFVLARQQDGLVEKYWKLVELNGQPVPKLAREPHMILKADGGRVNGFGGCNSFTGTYTLNAAAARIRFSQIAVTMRACVTGMDTERAFADVLGRADNYSLDGDRLTLNRARMAPLARFEAVYLH